MVGFVQEREWAQTRLLGDIPQAAIYPNKPPNANQDQELTMQNKPIHHKKQFLVYPTSNKDDAILLPFLIQCQQMLSYAHCVTVIGQT